MDVLVAGGTGFIGRHLCAQLADRGHDVTAFSRSPDAEAVPEEVAVETGDVTDPDSLAALPDTDAVVNLVALSPLFRPDGGEEMHDRVHRRGTENLVERAEAAGADRFVQLSALGAEPNGDTAYIRAKGAAERAVEASAIPHVIYRPSVVFGDGGEFVSFTRDLKETFAPGVPIYPLPGGGRTRFQPIWVGDLAPMIADGVDGDYADGTYELGGPETLSLRAVVELVFKADGRDVSILSLPMGVAKVGLTAMGTVGGSMGPDQYRSLTFDNTTDDNDVDAFGRQPYELRSFDEYLGLVSDTETIRV